MLSRRSRPRATAPASQRNAPARLRTRPAAWAARRPRRSSPMAGPARTPSATRSSPVASGEAGAIAGDARPDAGDRPAPARLRAQARVSSGARSRIVNAPPARGRARAGRGVPGRRSRAWRIASRSVGGRASRPDQRWRATSPPASARRDRAIGVSGAELRRGPAGPGRRPAGAPFDGRGRAPGREEAPRAEPTRPRAGRRRDGAPPG